MEVSYSLNEAVNLKTAFSQANAFDKLPIIPEYEELIGESVDQEKGIKEFNLGIRLKLNGEVNTYQEDSVLDYFINEIDPDSQRHKEQLQDPVKGKFFKEKVLTTACLYYFIFAVDEERKIEDKDYNPIPKFEQDVLKKLKPGTTDDEVREVLQYVNSLALAYNVLPIDSNYKNIPYVIFNSGAMDKLGKNLFNQNQVFQSKEINILNLILSQE